MRLSFGTNLLSNLLLLSAGQFSLVSSVLYGDEQYGDIEGGRFWAFHSSGISVVNPESCVIEKEISKEQSGGSLPNAWYDGVYMEPRGSTDRHHRSLAHSDEKSHGYILINSGVTSFDDHENLEGGTGEVLVISTAPEDYDDPVTARVKVGGRPVHSYSVYTRDEFWTHSDADGHFYVIKLDDVTKHTGKRIAALVDEANHGKLLWDEGGKLKKHGFATSTGERTIFVMDMISHETTGHFNFTNNLDMSLGRCQGTHAIAYSSINNHIYVECVAGGGTLEIDVSDPTSPVFVAQHENASGSLYETPDGSFVVASDKGGNKLHIFKPQSQGQKSSIGYVVDVPGHPSTPTFYPLGTSNPSYIACMPLTENTNLNHRDKNKDIACDYYGCSGAKTPEDVASGVCLYDGSGRTLKHVKLEHIMNVTRQEAPFHGACNRCKLSNNYDEDGICICTPNCGSCAEPNYDASLSGVRCVDLKKLGESNSGSIETTLIKGAGAVKQGSPYAYSPQCGFGRTYRTHKRGGKYDASVADYPMNSLQIVNMKSQELKCQVGLPGNPDRVVYVPIQPGQQHAAVVKEDAGLSTEAIVGISVGAGIVVGLVGVLLFSSAKAKAGATAVTETTHDMETAAGAPVEENAVLS